MLKDLVTEIGYVESPSGDKLSAYGGMDAFIAGELLDKTNNNFHPILENAKNAPNLRTVDEVLGWYKKSVPKDAFVSLVGEAEGIVGGSWVFNRTPDQKRGEYTVGVCVLVESFRGHRLGSYFLERLHDIIDSQEPRQLTAVMESTNQFAFQLAASHGYRLIDEEECYVEYPIPGVIKMHRPKMPRR